MALVGITTALLVNMLGQARIWTMAAREHMIPGFWAKVSPRFGTPIAAQVTMGAASGQAPLSLFCCIVPNMPHVYPVLDCSFYFVPCEEHGRRK